MTARQLSVLESGYLMALCVMDLYAQTQQTQQIAATEADTEPQRLRLGVLQYAATQGLDWNEYEELAEWLAKKGIVNETEHDENEATAADKAAA